MKRNLTMRRSMMMASLAVSLVMGAGSAAPGGFRQPLRCGPDAVVAGTVCLDAYEASMWRVPDPTTTNAFLVRKIRQGRATRADLIESGATQLGTAGDDYAPCTDDGQTCANAGKRLPTSAEWQVGANGTPDPGPDNRTTDCNSAGNIVAGTGSRSNCVSARGAFDMVGNLEEWVADWVPRSTECSGWRGFSNDRMCLSGASTDIGGPAARARRLR